MNFRDKSLSNSSLLAFLLQFFTQPQYSNPSLNHINNDIWHQPYYNFL